MKKYLLFTTGAGHQDDDDLLSNSGACLIGDFDTIEECIKKAREDLLAEATDTAINAVDNQTGECLYDSWADVLTFDSEEEAQDYMEDYELGETHHVETWLDY